MQDTTALPQAQKSRRPSILFVFGTVVLVLLNMFLHFVDALRASHNSAYAAGSALFALTCPFIVASLFLVGERFRNSASFSKIALWTSVVILLTKLGQLAQPSSVVG